jgi:hypothetical protein
VTAVPERFAMLGLRDLQNSTCTTEIRTADFFLGDASDFSGRSSRPPP